MKFVAHSQTVLSIALLHGWLPGARYTNLRDVRRFDRLGFLDIEWLNYSHARHLKAARQTRPLLTVARDITDRRMFAQVIAEAGRQGRRRRSSPLSGSANGGLVRPVGAPLPFRKWMRVPLLRSPTVTREHRVAPVVSSKWHFRWHRVPASWQRRSLRLLRGLAQAWYTSDRDRQK